MNLSNFETTILFVLGALGVLVAVDKGVESFRHLFLRRRSGPFDPEAARSVSLEVEAALITAASAVGAPVAPLVHLARPQDGLGEAHITRRISGETLGRKIVSDPRFDAVRPGLARQCGAILAQHFPPRDDGNPNELSDSVVVLG